MDKIAPALVKAKQAFGPALKDRTNPAFRSKYADLGACIEAVDDALLANGIALIQRTSEDATGVTVETVFLHESGQELACGKLHVPASKQDPQGYGSALTYARRYSLMAACGIAPEDDDGNAASGRHTPAVKPTVIRPSEECFKSLQPEVQTLLRKAAPWIDKAMPEIAVVAERVQMTLDNYPKEEHNDVRAGLEWLLDSKTRSAIKAHEAAQ